MTEAEKKLQVLYTILQGYETINPPLFTENLAGLHHHILYFHWLFEYCLDFLIALKIAPLLENSNSIEEGEAVAMRHVNIFRLLVDVSFFRKVSIVYEFELISKEIREKLKDINAYRNDFAHPNKPALEPYINPDKQVEVLEKIKSTYDLMQEIMKNTGYFTLPAKNS